jgi:hypothetical protein
MILIFEGVSGKTKHKKGGDGNGRKKSREREGRIAVLFR